MNKSLLFISRAILLVGGIWIGKSNFSLSINNVGNVEEDLCSKEGLMKTDPHATRAFRTISNTRS